MRISLPKKDWEIIASDAITAAENPQELTDEQKQHLRMLYFEIRYRIKNGIK